MHTRSSSNLPVKSPPDPSTFNPKHRNCRRSKQPFILEESPIYTMADQRTMAELLRVPTEGYAKAIVVSSILAEQFELKHSGQPVCSSKNNPRILFSLGRILFPNSSMNSSPSRTTNLRNEISNFQHRFDETFHEAWDQYKDVLRACPHHVFTELHQLDTFYNALNPTNQDFLNSTAGGNLLERHTQDMLTIIENKSKVRNSRNKSTVSQVKSSDANSNSSSEIAKLTHAVNQQTSAVTTAMTAILKQFQATPPLTSEKAVKEIYVTCSGAHPYYQCLASDGNNFPELRDNIQGYVAAAVINYNKGNSGYRPPDQDLTEYTIKVPHSLVQKPKPPFQRNFVVHQRDPLHPNIPYPSRTLKQKQKEKDEVQMHKIWQMFKQLHINITLADAFILIPKYHKMLKALFSNKEKLLELANTPFNENCSAIIFKNLPKKLRDPRKFLIPCGFSELKCKALADLGAGINLMPLSVWKKIGLPEIISTRMTFELANQAICTPAGIARDVFVPVGKFTFPADFVIVDYESDPRVPLILGRRFLRTASALIDVHREEMILRDGDERLTLNIRHDMSSYSNQPQKESINMINICDDSSEDFLEKLFTTNHQSDNPTFSSHPKLTSPEVKDDVFDPEGGNVLIEKLLDLDSTKDPCEKMLNINLLIAKIKSLNDNPTPDHVLKPLSLFPILVEDNDSFLEKFDTSYSDNSLPEYETFSNHTKEMNSGSTTTHADYSLPKYDSFLFKIEPDQGKLTSVVLKDNLEEPRVHIFYFDVEEKNSGSTTIHVDISLLDLKCFNFKPDPGELTSIVDSDIRKNVPSTKNVNLPAEKDHSSLFTYVVWIFLSFLTYPMVPLNLLSLGNEDIIFDPVIANYHFPSLLPDVSNRCETFMKFNVYPKLLNESLIEIFSSSCSPMEQ
uniref:Reverse transcriptase domain-containing protein n=1 Tax=Tanacetum cinerariifolium TaxID=118510 RepID=A0A6L2NWY4_TANCI|nr:reverse transcriptase domain-containing protein [Tanacetum cinerariifolium]